MFVDGVNDLRPEVPTDFITAIDAIVQPFSCEIGCSDPVLLDQVPRRFGRPWRTSPTALHCVSTGKEADSVKHQFLWKCSTSYEKVRVFAAHVFRAVATPPKNFGRCLPIHPILL